MIIGVFASASRGESAGDLVNEAMKCYEGFADEVLFNVEPWPKDFSWPHIGKSFQDSYEALDTDWVIHADLDFIFHQKDYGALRQALKDYPYAPAVSFYKYQFILPDRYNLKSRLVIAVNKAKFGERIRFDSGGDLCQPSLDGEYIKPNDVPESRIPFYNYEKIAKTKEQVEQDVNDMEAAYERHFKRPLYATEGQSAYEGWFRMMQGRFNKPSEHIKLEDHPAVMQQAIATLRPDQFGYDGFGRLERNDYA